MAIVPSESTIDLRKAQRRILGVLSAAQVVSGVGVAVGLALSSILMADLSGSIVISGFAGTATVLGAALLALPTARAAGAGGRRAGLTLAYGCASVGATLSAVAIALRSWPLLLAALVLMGGGSAGNLAARYSATDLSPPGHAARHLSLVVWATTVGTVAGPNLATPAEAVGVQLGLPENTGPFAMTGLTFLLASLIVNVALRPDPLLTARELGHTTAGARPVTPPPAASSAPPATAPATAPPTTPAVDFDSSARRDPTRDRSEADLDPEAARAVKRGATEPVATMAARKGALSDAWSVLSSTPAARTALTVIAASHTAMVSIMSMTPVHLDHEGSTVTIIGMVISVHIAGMYVLSPAVGWLADRLGRTQVMIAGMALLFLAAVLSGSAGHGNVAQVTVGLFLLGLGWSCGLVAGSAMLSEAVPIERRPAVQGLSDLTMNVCGAIGTVAAGAIVGTVSYGLLGAFVAVPVAVVAGWLFLGLRRVEQAA